MQRKKLRESHLTPTADVLHSLLQKSKSPLATQFFRWRIWKTWDQVVGKSLARTTEPVGYHKGCLYIWVNSAPRLQEMTFLTKPMIEKLNEFAGRQWVYSIRWTLDRKSVPKDDQSSRKSTAQNLQFLFETEAPTEEKK